MMFPKGRLDYLFIFCYPIRYVYSVEIIKHVMHKLVSFFFYFNILNLLKGILFLT